MTQVPPFAVFLEEHRRSVYRFLMASVGPGDADDVFQETFMSALRAYPRLRDASNLRSWVFTIAARKVVDFARARSRRPLPSAELGEGPAVAAPELDGDDRLWAALRSLPPRQRAAVALRHVLDRPYEEIAEVMGTSEDAARANVHQGVKRLREEWSHEAS